MRAPMIAHMGTLELNLLKRYPGKTNKRIRKIAQRELDRREKEIMRNSGYPQYWQLSK